MFEETGLTTGKQSIEKILELNYYIMETNNFN